MFGLIWSYMRQHKWRYLWIAVLIVVHDVTLLVPTQVTQRLVDQLSQKSLTQERLVSDIAFLAVATLVNYGSGHLWHYQLFQGSVTFKFDLQQRAFAKLIRMRTPFYEKFRSGDILTRFSTDVGGLLEVIGYGLMIVVYAGGVIAFILPAMLVLSWQVTLVAMLPMLLMMVLMYMISRKQDQLIDDNREAVAQLNNEVLEAIEGVQVTRAYSKKAVQEKRFRKQTQTLAETGNRIGDWQSLYSPVVVGLLGVSTVLILWIGAHFLQKGTVSLGQVLALQLYMVSLVDPFMMLADLILVYQTGKTSFEKIHELIETGDDMEADGQLVLTKPQTYAFENYQFTYPQAERPSLVDINWVLQAGQTVGIVGKTGSGKTTLVRQFLRQYPLGQGAFIIDGRSVLDYQRSSVEALIGYVPQEHVLFSKSVRDNILLGNPAASAQDLAAAIEMAAFTEDVERMADGLETMIGERGLSISGGQKQRISIARALIRQPELLILDDSLSAVDAKTERQIIQRLQEERQGKTNLIVAHRLSAVHHADWVLVLDDGQIIEEGRPADLLAAGGWYADQYNRQQTQKGGQ
ncbi:ABC transporter ATP-binding protein [Streptococcus entericus]|uniref:ABC transporter ATP-binding protein n=1 Tax=Streptococcus entericus TaxID=155680 RepID=UPI0003617852|nr:ABC transporter ATP-binding protein [Streptococcus entericus]